MSVRLSVIVPTHNRCGVLQEKLESLQTQTLSPERFEVIVCVDGSTDGTLEMLERFEAEFALRILHHPEAKGVVAARNACAAAAVGELLLMSDDDCILDPQTLEAHVQLHDETPKSVVGVGVVHQPGAKQRSVTTQPGRAAWIHATGANTSMPKAAFEMVGGYDTYFRNYGGEDADLALRLRERGLEFRRVSRADVTHIGSLFEAGFEEKAFSAGKATQHIFERFPSAEVGLMLGVHPFLLQLKKLVFKTPLKYLVEEKRRRYELAYIAGIEAERAKSTTQPLQKET